MQIRSQFFNITTLVLLLGIPLDQARADDADLTGTLKIQVQGLASDEGNLRFVLFDSKKNFLKDPVRAEVVEITDRQAQWIVEELSYGIYAVLVHHDVNSNGKMERHWYGKPKEPTGVSNDAPAKFGPPKFKNAQFLFESQKLTLSITVQ